MGRYGQVLATATLTLAISSYAAPAGSGDASASITTAVASTARPPQQLARDADCKPAEVVSFTGIKSGDKISDLAPGDGYFTRILSKVVGSQGKVYAFVPQRGYRDIQAQRAEEQKQRQEGKNPTTNPVDAILPLQHTSDFSNVMVIYENLMAYGGNFGVPDQLDAVFTSRGYHELHNKVDGPINNAPLDMTAVNKAIFRALKPGGVYVVADYAASPGAGFNQSQELNRVEADAVKQEVIAAGFMFDGESKVLANASDDHAKLATDPPASDKADQFLLRFKKPANVSANTKRQPRSVMKNFFGNTFVLGTPDQRFRTIFYHEDGTYQEFGMNDMQMAHYYFDADGHNCMYHEAPAQQEGFVTCHPFEQEHLHAKVGDTWTEPPNMGGGQPTKVALVKGHQYPNFTPRPRQQ